MVTKGRDRVRETFTEDIGFYLLDELVYKLENAYDSDMVENAFPDMDKLLFILNKCYKDPALKAEYFPPPDEDLNDDFEVWEEYNRREELFAFEYNCLPHPTVGITHKANGPFAKSKWANWTVEGWKRRIVEKKAKEEEEKKQREEWCKKEAERRAKKMKKAEELRKTKVATEQKAFLALPIEEQKKIQDQRKIDAAVKIQQGKCVTCLKNAASKRCNSAKGHQCKRCCMGCTMHKKSQALPAPIKTNALFTPVKAPATQPAAAQLTPIIDNRFLAIPTKQAAAPSKLSPAPATIVQSSSHAQSPTELPYLAKRIQKFDPEVDAATDYFADGVWDQKDLEGDFELLEEEAYKIRATKERHITEGSYKKRIQELSTKLAEKDKEILQLKDDLQVSNIELNNFISVPVINVDTNEMETMLPPEHVLSKKRKRVAVEKIVSDERKVVKVKIEKVNGLLDASQKATKAAEEEARNATDALEDALECILCMDRTRDTLFLPCCHLNTCGTCASMHSVCPTCKQPIQRQINKIFIS